MKTNFIVHFPDARNYAQEVLDSSGRRIPTRANKDVRRGNRVLLAMDRALWDSVTTKHGSLTYKSRIIRNAMPDVDFEAEDGTLHRTAEECLAHELQTRFGVSTLAELQDAMAGKKPAANEKPCGTSATEPQEIPEVTISEAIRLVQASLATKGRTPSDIQKDTGLPESTIYNILTQNPDQFTRGPGGRYQKAA